MSGFTLREVNNELKGRLALVTGASGGIGSACARALAAEGCDLALHYSSNAAAAELLASELAAKYPSQTFTTHAANLFNRAATRSLVPSVLSSSHQKHQAISILVANAGLGRRIRDVAAIGEEDWDDMMEVNARSQFVVTKGVLEGMRKQGWGRVILVGSIASKGGGINGCHYAATKGALSSMGFNLATCLASENITVNIVSPAMIGDTGMIPAPKSQSLAEAPTSSDSSATSNTASSAVGAADIGLSIASTVPVGRLGQPVEVANVVLMFAKTGYLTGQDILLTGGLK